MRVNPNLPFDYSFSRQRWDDNIIHDSVGRSPFLKLINHLLVKHVITFFNAHQLTTCFGDVIRMSNKTDSLDDIAQLSM